MKIIAFKSNLNEDKTITISNSLNESTTSSDLIQLLDFLYLSIEKTDDISRATWNIDSFIAPILRMFKDNELIDLNKYAKIIIPPYNIFYVKDKVFSLRDIRNYKNMTINYYGIAQYFEDIDEPSTLDVLQKYCNSLNEALKEMNMVTTKITSPVRIYQDCILKNMFLSKAEHIPQNVQDLALQCSGKLWIEAYKLGYFENAYDYDISSAFPTASINLIDIRYGEWIEYNEIPPSSKYGYAEVKVTINKDIKLHPIMKHYYNKGETIWHTPTGTWDTILTRNEILFIRHFHIGLVEIKNGFWYIPESYNHPLLKAMGKILSFKNNPNPIIQTIAKRMSVGIYGKFLEKKGNKNGEFFNPVYGAEISTNPKLALASIIYKNNAINNIIHIKVDGFLSDKMIDCTV